MVTALAPRPTNSVRCLVFPGEISLHSYWGYFPRKMCLHLGESCPRILAPDLDDVNVKRSASTRPKESCVRRNAYLQAGAASLQPVLPLILSRYHCKLPYWYYRLLQDFYDWILYKTGQNCESVKPRRKALVFVNQKMGSDVSRKRNYVPGNQFGIIIWETGNTYSKKVVAMSLQGDIWSFYGDECEDGGLLWCKTVLL